MRARQRHLNPRQAGATFAWDARFNIDGHANNGSVATWTDRGSDTATQGSSGSRPVYKENEINGRPAVVFDGSNDSLSTASVNSTTEISVLSVAKRPWKTGKFAPIVASNYAQATGIAFLDSAGGFHDWTAGDFLWFGNGFNSARAPRALGPFTDYDNGTVVVMSGVLSSSAARAWHGDVRVSTRIETTGSVPSVTAALNVGGNSGTSDFGDWSLGSVAYWRNTGLSDALRKRLQSAAAYSFKVAC